MIVHHPGEEILLDYGAGCLPEALALVVATHVSMCSICSAHVHLIERCGSALLDDAAGDDLSEHALDEILGRLDISEPIVPQQVTRLDKETEAVLPGPLRRYVTKNLVDLHWRRVGRLFEEHRLPLARSDIKAALYRLPPGSLVPKHSHRGEEYTLVLAGGFRDGDKTFARGDFSAMDPSNIHQPIVEPDEPCLCLIALDAPVKLSGAVGFLLNPFLKL
jgi:putative transcriptional regulator